MNGMSECRKKCWMIAGGVGLLALIVLLLFADFLFLPALIWAVIVGVIVGFALPYFICSDEAQEQITAPPITPTPEPATAPEPAVEPEPEAAAEQPEPEAEPEPEPEPVHAPEPVHFAGEPSAEAVEEAATYKQPEMLAEPRGGKGDDLKKIKGVGAKLETTLNTNGIWHFDQIAAWSAEEVAWADENLVTIKGRVSRDDWVGQAKALAAGGTTEFADRVDKGDVY